MDKINNSQSENCAKLHSFAEFEAIKKENDELKAKLAQSEAAYKNMLDRYKINKDIDWKKRFQELKAKYDKILFERNKLIHEDAVIRHTIDSLRGSICNIHNKLADLVEDVGSSSKSPIQRIISPTQLVTPLQPAKTRAKMQEEQFIKYVREMASIFKKTGTLGGISQLAHKYGVSALAKIQFFQLGLQNEPLTDEVILEAYKHAKKK